MHKQLTAVGPNASWVYLHPSVALSGSQGSNSDMKLLVSPEAVWYEIPVPNHKDAQKYFDKMTSAERSAVRTRAAALYEEQAHKYVQQKTMTPADRQWLATVLKEGTQSDKISAILLQAQECPFYGLEWIGKLLSMASGTSRSESFPAIEALKDVFILILPPKATERSLTAWKARPLTDNKDLTPTSFLLVAYFEDMLRQMYIDYIKVLEIMLHDQVQNGRERAMRIVFDLSMAYKSDFSEALLVLLVNKLGDPARKVASRVVYYLQSVVEKHEELTLMTCKAVQHVSTKPDLANDKPAFYGMTFFSQLRLNEASPAVTDILLTTYQHFLGLFLKQLENSAKEKKKKNKTKRRKLDADEDEIPRVMKVVLLGLTRAIPFVKSADDSSMNQYAVKLLSITARIRSYPTLLQASTLIYKLFTEQETMSDSSLQLISDLVSKNLLDYPRMSENSSSFPHLFKLLFRIVSSVAELNSSSVLPCLRAIVKSMLSVAVMINNPAFPAAALLLVNEALVLRPGLRLAISFPDDVSSDCGSWKELDVLAKHYHPTVARYSATLLQPKGEIDVGAEPEDPFVGMTNSAFLERFIKNEIKL